MPEGEKTMKECECSNVQPRGGNIWKCMVCSRSFIPLDAIEDMERIEQKPVVVPIERVA